MLTYTAKVTFIIHIIYINLQWHRTVSLRQHSFLVACNFIQWVDVPFCFANYFFLDC